MSVFREKAVGTFAMHPCKSLVHFLYNAVFIFEFRLSPLVVVMFTILVTLSSGIALAATPENLRTSLVYGTTGSLITRDLFIDSRRVTFEVRAISRVALARADEGDVDISIHHDTNVSSTFIHVGHPVHTRYLVQSLLGIGAGSDLTHQAGPIAILREPTRAHMVLHSTFENFAASCIPDSIITINASSPLRVQYNLTNGTFGESSYNVAFGNMMNFRLSIPQPMILRITELLIAGGASDDFHHCSRAAIASLPNIAISFETGASLVYYPEDYVDFNEEERRCTLRVSQSLEEIGFGIDPLKLVGQNVRVTRENIWNICESAAMI
jgi:hypothetical protein